MSYAKLSNPTAGVLEVAITSYSTGFETLLENAQLQLAMAYYPVKSVQDNLSVTIQCNNRNFWERVQLFIRTSQLAALNSNTDQSTRIFYPARNIDYRGYIINSPAGQTRWDWTPTITIQFLLAVDLLDNLSGIYSKGSNWVQDFTQVQTAKQVAQNAVRGDPSDSILGASPPMIRGGIS